MAPPALEEPGGPHVVGGVGKLPRARGRRSVAGVGEEQGGEGSEGVESEDGEGGAVGSPLRFRWSIRMEGTSLGRRAFW